MGMSCSNREGQMHFGWTGWSDLLHLAYYYGWDPEGAIFYFPQNGRPFPEVVSWEDGGYGINGFQSVTAADALAMAQALERALAHLPDVPARARDRRLGDDDMDFLWIDSDWRATLVEFIGFAKKGGFGLS